MTDAQIQRRLDLLSAKTEKALAAEYAAAREIVKKEIADLIEKYGQNGLEELAKKNRLIQLQSFLDREIYDLTGKAEKNISGLVTESFEDAYKMYGNQVMQGEQTQFSFGLVNRDTIASLLTSPTAAGISVMDTLAANRFNFMLSVRKTMAQGMILGESYYDIAKRINTVFNTGYNDAVRIARTEGTRASGEGQSMAYDRAEELGVELRRVWSAAHNDRTRPSHRNLDGQNIDPEGIVRDKDGKIVARDGRFTVQIGKNKGAKASYPGGFGIAAEDINCFPETSYLFADNVEKIYRRKYKGLLYRITVSDGRTLTGTPNHPIFTDKGWVGLNTIDKGDNIGSAFIENKVFSFSPYINNTPSIIAKIFNLFYINFPSERRTSIEKYFHGDRSASDIDIICTNGLLLNAKNTISFDKICKFIFKSTNILKGILFNNGSFAKFVIRSFNSANGVMSIFRKIFAVFWGCMPHAIKHGFTSVACFISYPIKVFINTITAAIKKFRYLFNRLSGFVQFDEVICIEKISFHGYVFNLQTKKGTYLASDNITHGNGKVKAFIVHNCRCRVYAEVIMDE